MDDRTDNMNYECINRTILYGNIVNMYLINNEGNYGVIDADDSTCHGYYFIIFYSSLYTLQSDLNIDSQVIYSGEIVCKGTYYFPINLNHH